MRKIALTLLVALFAWGATAQNQVNVEISDGIGNATLKQRMETNLSRLLTAINKASSQQADINFTGIGISDMASQSLTSLWANARFHCLDDDIVEHGLSLKRAGRVYQYQVRNIPVEMETVDEAYADDVNQEVEIDFDLNGKIIDFNISIDKHQYTRILKEGFDVGDAADPLDIVKRGGEGVDHGFRAQIRASYAYNQKDVKFLNQVFSDDALIVTGKVMTRVKRETGTMQSDVVFDQKTKAQYLANLHKIFSNPRTGQVHVAFDGYKIKRHGAKPNFYVVVLDQVWATNTYKDKGIVILLWDFKDREHPQILVRTWQPQDTDVQKGFDYIDNLHFK